MFTGLVQDLATIRNVERSAQSSVITIETALASQMQIGDSISINGVCLTATKIEGSLITVDVMVQTLKLSNLGNLNVGSQVNAELATRADARLGGHIVKVMLMVWGKWLQMNLAINGKDLRSRSRHSSRNMS